MRSVELFTGAGGLALGIEKAGFHHDTVVERDMAHRWVIVTASVLALIAIVPLFLAVGKDFILIDAAGAVFDVSAGAFTLATFASSTTPRSRARSICSRAGHPVSRFPSAANTRDLSTSAICFRRWRGQSAN